MKHAYHILPLALAAAVLAGCERKELEPEVQGGNRISLRAGVEEIKTPGHSRAAFTGQTPSAENPLSAAVWFTSETGSYPETLPQGWDAQLWRECNIPCHTSISFTGTGATFPQTGDDILTPMYPQDGRTVYCVGLYPGEGWSVEGNTWGTARHAISGQEDIMLAPQTQGSWTSHFTRQNYRHLLTWLKICVCATTPQAGEYWGEVQKITLRGTADEVSVDLRGEDGEGWSPQDYVSFLGNSDLTVTDRGGEGGIPLKITAQEVGEVFCRPASSYTLQLTCGKVATTDITVNLKALGGDAQLLSYPAGLQYVVTLYFHPYNVVEGVCTLEAWNAQHEDLYPL